MGQRIIDWIMKLIALIIAAVWVFSYSSSVSERGVGRYAFHHETGSDVYTVFDTREGRLIFVNLNDREKKVNYMVVPASEMAPADIYHEDVKQVR